MRRLIWMGALCVIAACGTQGEGERCNPLRATSDCNSGLTCIYPTAPNCGVSYCCAVDSNGVITDKDPNCQPDPSLDSVCMLPTESVDAAMSIDGGPDLAAFATSEAGPPDL